MRKLILQLGRTILTAPLVDHLQISEELIRIIATAERVAFSKLCVDTPE
jgi:hypothetical protein